MGQKDLVQKTLESYNDIFADIFNALLFNGESVIKEDELKDATTGSIFKSSGKLYSQERDVSKFWQNSLFQLALFGIENQSIIDVSMPLRIFSYDGAAYKNQLKKISLKQKFFPVITIVLYFGKGRWTKPLALSDVIDISPSLKPYFNDFKIHVFSMGYLPKKTRALLKSDFKQVADFFYNNEHKYNYRGSTDEIHHVEEVLTMLQIFSNDNRFKDSYNIIEKIKREGGTSNMCYILDQAESRGVAKGKKEGKKEIILKMLENNYPINEIKLITGASYKLINELKASLVCIPQ